MNVKLLHGDSAEKLKELPENSVDSVCCDPPYGLSFMNSKWDYDVPSTELWKEVIRVLKPGGHLLAFFGSRTYHRGVVNIEDAGFEVRDQLMWLYGCLSEDTEILTKNGWELYHKDIASSTVIAYNIDNNSFSYEKPLRSFCYENEYPAYHIQSDSTDQIVSRNHRVVVERGGRKEFHLAETCEQQEDIPFLESLSELPETIYDSESLSSETKYDLFKRMCDSKTVKNNEVKTENSNERERTNSIEMRLLSEGILAKSQTRTEDEKQFLLLRMQWENQRRGMETTRPQRAKMLVERDRGQISQKSDGRQEPSMERWRNLHEKERELQSSEIREMPEGIYGDVSEGRVCNGTPPHISETHWKDIVKVRSGASYRSRSYKQFDRESDVIQEQQRSQTLRTSWKARTTLATVKEVEYEGKVWCVEVPSGAFVARRNGKIFITGNSGFPKSHNISKAIDKKLGVERKVIGEKVRGDVSNAFKNSITYAQDEANRNNNAIFGYGVEKLTLPTSIEAKQWEGWGTALKPAHEPIVLARKPFKGTVVDNVIEHGVGGINIEECKIARCARDISGWSKTGSKESENLAMTSKNYAREPKEDAKGRWPANIILEDNPEVKDLFPTNNNLPTYRFFYCTKTSKWERNAGLDHTKDKIGGGMAGTKDKTLKTGSGNERNNVHKNNHPTVKPVDLMRYLVKLITPPKGTVLDPFLGSGSTGIACRIENFNFIGCELNEEYLEIAKERINNFPIDEFKKRTKEKFETTIGKKLF